MRKKSHISLVKYLANSKGMEELLSCKKSLYVGSILPDCTPSFITRRHSIEETFDILKKEIRKITQDYDVNKGIGPYYCRHLGIVTHYIADYFTFPHNSIYPGNIKGHCEYENELKFALRKYVLTDEAKKKRESSIIFTSIEEIFEYIKEKHQEYLEALKAVKFDCLYIVDLCHKVVDAILQFLEYEFGAINEPTLIATI
jgi:hypothetical protein